MRTHYYLLSLSLGAILCADARAATPCEPGFAEAVATQVGSNIPEEFRDRINDHEVHLTCDLTLEPHAIVRRRIFFDSPASSNVTLDCNGGSIWAGLFEGVVHYNVDMIVIKSQEVEDPIDPVNNLPTFLPPTDITIRNCNIIGSVRIFGMGPNGEARWVGVSSRIDGDHPARLRAAAPTRITLDNLDIQGQNRNPLYLSPGVTHVTFMNSRIHGHSTRVGMYLDAESAFNTIRNNDFDVEVTDDYAGGLYVRRGPQLAIDGSSYNKIIGNRFRRLSGGGVFTYRNCGEGGTIRHISPSFNEIINNVFFYPFPNPFADPAVHLGSKGDEWYRYNCDHDEHGTFVGGSRLFNSSYSRSNAVMQNQVFWLPADFVIRRGDSTNRFNLVRHNTTVVEETLETRSAGCYLPNNAAFDFVLDGESAELYELIVGPDGLPACHGRFATCSNGDWVDNSTFSCMLSAVDFNCQITESNALCDTTAACPAGWRVLGVAAACNLEFGDVTDEMVASTPLKSMRVVRFSDEAGDGICQVADKSIHDGDFEVRGIGGLKELVVACREKDDNGGECHIKGKLYCRPETAQDFRFAQSCKGDGDCEDKNVCTTDNCGDDQFCDYECDDAAPPTVIDACPPEALTLECGVDTDPGFNPAFEDACDPSVELFAISNISPGNCPIDGYLEIIGRRIIAVDDCENEASCAQSVTTVDTRAPQLTCPARMIVECRQPAGVPVADVGLVVGVSDECDTDVALTDDRPAEFYRPTCGNAPTVVTFTAIDDCGNVGTCEVAIEVVGAMCCPGIADGDLTLMPVSVDLRQDTNGFVNTKAKFDIWNQNEVRFSGTERCISCWDQTAFSLYNSPNQLLMSNLHTDKGRARIDGLASTICPGSVASPLLGVAVRAIRFEGGAGQRDEVFRSAIPLPGTGSQSARILYDLISPPDDAMALAGVGGLQIQPAGRTAAGLVAGDRGSISTKGSVFALPLVQVRWDAAGQLIEDTFVSVTNDGAAGVSVQFYFVQGDGALDAVYVGDPARLLERAHEGWNNVDNNFVLTANQTVYWSAFTGTPTGVSPWTVLDSGDSPGRLDMDPDNRGGRVIRGFILGWAVDAEGREIHWNHLTANAMLIHYRDTSAAEYEGWAFGCVSGAAPGAWCDSTPGELDLDGVEYASAPDKLLMDFYTVGSEALSHPAARP